MVIWYVTWNFSASSCLIFINVQQLHSHWGNQTLPAQGLENIHGLKASLWTQSLCTTWIGCVFSIYDYHIAITICITLVNNNHKWLLTLIFNTPAIDIWWYLTSHCPSNLSAPSVPVLHELPVLTGWHSPRKHDVLSFFKLHGLHPHWNVSQTQQYTNL